MTARRIEGKGLGEVKAAVLGGDPVRLPKVMLEYLLFDFKELSSSFCKSLLGRDL